LALHRVTLDRIAEYHRHHYRARLHHIQAVFQEAYSKQAAEIERLRKQGQLFHQP
jgi:hypothetical protein